MKRKLSNEFLSHYLVVFALTLTVTALSFSLLTFGSKIASDVFAKNRYPAGAIMRDDYTKIDAAPVIANGGSVQIVDKDYRVVFSGGKDANLKARMSAAEFTDFLTQSKQSGIPYHHDIRYNPSGEFWLIVTFPASIRLNFEFVFNTKAATGDFGKAAFILAAVIAAHLLLLAVVAFFYSRVTAAAITRPLRKLCDGTRLLREGDYSVRVDLRLKNEFAELQDTFNDMAARIEREMALRKKSEEDRRRLILDISHDLKNPLASVCGYAELCLKEPNPTDDDKNAYLKVILSNGQRANRLLGELFELSKMDSPEFTIKPRETDLCEYLRQICGELLPALEGAGFGYAFDIPEKSVRAMVDGPTFGRIFENLLDNAVRYNVRGTTVGVSLHEEGKEAVIVFKDDGRGIPEHLAKDIFKPFVKADDARSPGTGGSGLGLSIAKKIAEAHGGDLTLLTDTRKGSAFRLTIPTI